MTEHTAETTIVARLDNAQKILDKMFERPTENVFAGKQVGTDLGMGGWLYENFTAAVLLEALRRVDPDRADVMAKWLDETLEDGSVVGELVWQWREQINRGHDMTMVGPVLDEPAPPSDARTFDWTLLHGKFKVLAVETETPGLVAAQQVGGFLSEERYRMVPGKWCVVHESSGLPLPVPKGHVEGFPLDIARAVAKRLGTFSIDWTAPKEQVLAAVKEHTGEVVAAIGEASECRYCSDVDHLPVRPFRKPEVAR